MRSRSNFKETISFQGIDGSDQDLWNGNIISGNDDIILALSEKLGF